MIRRRIPDSLYTEERMCTRCGMEFPDHLPGDDICFPVCELPHVEPASAEEELRVIVRTIMYDPVEPFYLWIARKLSRWLL